MAALLRCHCHCHSYCQRCCHCDSCLLWPACWGRGRGRTGTDTGTTVGATITNLMLVEFEWSHRAMARGQSCPAHESINPSHGHPLKLNHSRYGQLSRFFKWMKYAKDVRLQNLRCYSDEHRYFIWKILAYIGVCSDLCSRSIYIYLKYISKVVCREYTKILGILFSSQIGT